MYPPTRLTTGIAILAAFLLLYTINSISAHDPTSIFFKSRTGYAPRYSATRRQQAESFISSYDSAAVVKAGPEEKRKLCIGIPSFKRENVQFLPDAVGSLLEGLTPEERQEIYLIVFLAHSNPAVHPAYNEAWLPGLADKVLTYEFGKDRMQHIVNLEAKGGKLDEKPLFDYSYVLTKCMEQFTPYIAIFEDDTVAMDGWYHRTLAAIHEAEQQAALKRAKPNFLYLRLFYTEEFLGWNAENWKLYLFNSICVALLPTLTILLMRYTKPTTKLSLMLATRRTLLYIYASLAVLILLFFALGRLTMLPMANGVHEMSRYGCCSQALLFPNAKAIDLIAYFKERRVGYVDVLTEDLARERDELRYAVTPSLVQHVGRTRTNEEDPDPAGRWGRTVADKIWSFSFEGWDWKALRQEHEVARTMKAEAKSQAAS